MQTNHPRGRWKTPLFWMIVVIAALLAVAFGLYSGYVRTHSPQVPIHVVARGKIPPPPPSTSMESSAESSASMESAPATEAGSNENASGLRSQSAPESTTAASAAASPQENAPEMNPENAVRTHEEAADASDNQVPALDSGSAQSAKTIPTPSDLPATNAKPTPTVVPPNVPKTVPQYTIQVGAYRTKDNADRQVAQLREKGFDAYLDEKDEKAQLAWYFVRFGRFEDFESADKALTAFKEQQQMDGTIVRSHTN